MPLTIDDSVAQHVTRVRDGSLEWFIAEYEGKEKIKVTNSGSGNFDEFKASLAEDRISFAFLRMISGDQESKRVKFVFYMFVGSSANVMAKSRVSVHKPDMIKAIGQFHVEMFVDGLSDVNEQELRTKIKKSGGADYDQGSNAGGAGYQTSAADIKAQAKGAYLSKEKETNIGPVIFEKSALPQTTPIDLKGRPMVAPPSEAMRNVNHTGNLDVDKFKGKVSVVASGGESSPAPPPAPAPAPPPSVDPAVADAASGLLSAVGDMMNAVVAGEQGGEMLAMLKKMHDIGLAAEAAAALPDGGFDASLVPAEEPADPAVLAMPGDDAAKARVAGGPDIFSAAKSEETLPLLKDLVLAQPSAVYEKDSDGNTALMVAAEAGNYAACDFLLKSGSRVNAYNNAGLFPLFMAAFEGHFPVVNTLLEGGAAVNAIVAGPEGGEKRGASCLLCACGSGYMPVVRLLVMAKANIGYTCGGLDAITLATFMEQQKIADYLTSVTQ